jgi:hypothetical protein
MKLTITSIKPNPAGKDHPRYGGPSPTQLAGEWVDFRNDNGQTVNLDGVALYHRAYSGQQWRWAKIMTFTGNLGAGEIVRVHSGQRRDGVISAEDLPGATYHLFTGRDEYVWNNKEGDAPLLHIEPRNETIDTASYDPNPPEGVVLLRQADKLVARARAAGW